MSDDHSAPRFVSSVAARLAGAPAHALRAYERAGLLHPVRTLGGVRLYSESDIETAQRVHDYSRRGVNLSGVKVLLEIESRQEHVENQRQGGTES